MRNAEKFGHTTAGIFLLDLPLALLLAICFHTFIKQPLLQHLPANFRLRFENKTAKNWTRFVMQQPLIVLYSLLLGTGSHLLWDGFTHEGGFFVNLFPILLYNIFAGLTLFVQFLPEGSNHNPVSIFFRAKH